MGRENHKIFVPVVFIKKVYRNKLAEINKYIAVRTFLFYTLVLPGLTDIYIYIPFAVEEDSSWGRLAGLHNIAREWLQGANQMGKRVMTIR